MQFYPFGLEKNETTGSTELLGGKGAGLLWLANQGVPVPPGFVIPTSVWAEYDKKPKSTMKLIAKELPAYLAKLEAHFGYLPLLSVRSGARVSCPGMMDTILNVGLDENNLTAWAKRLGPKCFGDSFYRLVLMYGSVVAGLRRESLGVNLKSALDGYREQTGQDFPTAQAQLLGAIEAVFKSWDNNRANEYRKMHSYAREWGTAVTVQAMVFGNLNDQSGTGVLFTRNPDTGGMLVTGEFLANAQGEDIVAGIRTPMPLDEMKTWNLTVHDQLLSQVIGLENLKKDMLDIEFTVQDGKLYLLQVRTGKRSATAAIKIAVDMEKQGLIDAKTAVKRVTLKQFDLAQMATLDPKFTKAPAFQGIPACSGVVTGKPVFTKEDAIACKEPCILVTHETTPDDIAGMKAAVGIVTMNGGMTSHAAVVARGMDRACIVGVGQSVESFKDIEVLSLDGATGRIWTEKVAIVGGSANGLIHEFNEMVCRTLGVVPVIFDVPTQKMDEALLYLGDKILRDDCRGTFAHTLNKVNHLYLDLVPSEEEKRYFGIVGAHNHVGRFLVWLEALYGKASGNPKFSKITLIATSEYVSSFKRIAPGTDLRSIVLSDKEVMLDGVDVNDPAIKRVLSWKKAEGTTVVSLGKYLADVKSIVSVQQAMHLLGEVS
jgi:phosphoenolpyruvate synthase/pyruvate phosphate dikinase